MPRSRRALITLLAVTAVIAVLPGGSVGAEPGPPAQPTAGPADTLTLVTGDQVRFARNGSTVRVLGVTPRPGHRPTGYVRLLDHGDEYVIPVDATAAVRAGTVDRRLFDVTKLVRLDLDDKHSDSLHVVVTGRPGFAAPKGTRVNRAVPALGLQALTAVKKDTADLWRSVDHGVGGRKLWLDAPVRATLDQSVPLVGAPQAWRAGYTGAGVQVAVLDTGVHGDHPDLANKVLASANFTETADTDDHYGHGTHVASTITGSGAASGGRYRGVAPDVRLLNGKVLDDEGYGTESGIVAGMQWAVQQGARVVNMSFGSGPSDGTDLISTELDSLSKSSGALFVVAAGNDSGPGTVGAPATADSALAVASTTKQDTRSPFSSQGPRAYDFGLKPEIAAPGSEIVAARAPGTLSEDAVNADYARLSGTSMATPHVAGAAAIVTGQHPDWTGQQVKAALMSSAKPLAGLDVFQQGAGRLDVAAATSRTVRASTTGAGFGQLSAPAVKKIGYVNDGAAPVTLSLALSVRTVAGSPAPQGLFTLDRTTVTVPAHGTATVLVRTTAATVGRYEGTVVATAGPQRAVTPLAAEVVAPTHQVTVKTRYRDGRPTSADDAAVYLQDEGTGDLYWTEPGEGTSTAQVPAGTYRAVGMIIEPAPEGGVSDTATEFGTVAVVGDKDTTTTIDAGKGAPVTVAVDDPTARTEPINDHVTMTSTVDGFSTVGVDLVGGKRYTVTPEPRPGLMLSYGGAWLRPRVLATTTGPDPYEVRDLWDLSETGYHGDVTGPVVDLGTNTDPAAIGDVDGKIVLFGATDSSGPIEDTTPLLTALKEHGAKLVLSTIGADRLDILPVLQTGNTLDAFELRKRLAAGPVSMRVLGRDYSPYVYFLQDTVPAGPGGKAWRFDRKGLATVDARYRMPSGNPYRGVQFVVGSDLHNNTASFDLVELALPSPRTEYYSPGVLWDIAHAVGYTDPADQEPSGLFSSLPREYRAGEHRATEWAGAPFAPRLPVTPPDFVDGGQLPWVYRQGDKVVTKIRMFSDTDRTHESSPMPGDSGTTTLLRNGSVVDTSDVAGVAEFTVPGGAADYRLVADATRTEPGWELSTKVHSEWTFRSAHTAPGTRTPLGLLDAGFVLPLDDAGATPAGRPLTGTVRLAHQDGVGPAACKSVTVDVSYDDGRTWRPARIRGSSVTIPTGGTAGGFATLRVHAVDTDGNTVTQVLTRAYRLR